MRLSPSHGGSDFERFLRHCARARTDRDLKGESYQRDTDSVSLTDLKFAWADNELTVMLPTVPRRTYLNVKLNDGEQRWTAVGN